MVTLMSAQVRLRFILQQTLEKREEDDRCLAEAKQGVLNRLRQGLRRPLIGFKVDCLYTVDTCIQTNIHPYIHTCIHTYVHSYTPYLSKYLRSCLPASTVALRGFTWPVLLSQQIARFFAEMLALADWKSRQDN